MSSVLAFLYGFEVCSFDCFIADHKCSYHFRNVADLQDFAVVSDYNYQSENFISVRCLMQDRCHQWAFYRASLIPDFFIFFILNFYGKAYCFARLNCLKEEVVIFQYCYSIFNFINFKNLIN